MDKGRKATPTCMPTVQCDPSGLSCYSPFSNLLLYLAGQLLNIYMKPKHLHAEFSKSDSAISDNDFGSSHLMKMAAFASLWPL